MSLFNYDYMKPVSACACAPAFICVNPDDFSVIGIISVQTGRCTAVDTASRRSARIVSNAFYDVYVWIAVAISMEIARMLRRRFLHHFRMHHILSCDHAWLHL